MIDLFPAKNGEQAGTIRASYANFGLIPYGHSMMGRLWFNSTNGDACEEFADDFFYRKKDKELMKRLEND